MKKKESELSVSCHNHARSNIKILDEKYFYFILISTCSGGTLLVAQLVGTLR
jgi:hypothetical protein